MKEKEKKEQLIIHVGEENQILEALLNNEKVVRVIKAEKAQK